MPTPEDLPPANLILQALHALRGDLQGLREAQQETTAEVAKTNGELAKTNSELAKTNARLWALEQRTTEGFLATNTKLAELAKVVSAHDRRLDHLLTRGLGAEVRDLRVRVTKLESARVARLAGAARSKPRR